MELHALHVCWGGGLVCAHLGSMAGACLLCSMVRRRPLNHPGHPRNSSLYGGGDAASDGAGAPGDHARRSQPQVPGQATRRPSHNLVPETVVLQMIRWMSI